MILARRLAVLILSLAVEVASSDSLAGQQLPDISGEVILVRANDIGIRRLVGRVSAITQDSITISPEQGLAQRLGLQTVDGVYVRRPRSSGQGARAGAVVGAVIGVGTGTILGFLATAGCESGVGDDCAGYGIFGPPAGVILGGLVGSLIGSISPGTRWARVYARPR